MQEWTIRHHVAGVDNAGEKTCPSKLKVRVEDVNILCTPMHAEITKQTQAIIIKNDFKLHTHTR